MSDSLQETRVRVWLPALLPQSIQDSLVTRGADFSAQPEEGGVRRSVLLPWGWSAGPSVSFDAAEVVQIFDATGEHRGRVVMRKDACVAEFLSFYRIVLVPEGEEYDRSARVSAQVVAHDALLPLYECSMVAGPIYGDAYFDALKRIFEDVHGWLDREYPQWRNPLAYWAC